MASPSVGILKNTVHNIVRNKWLSLATVLVTTIVFTTASFFIISSVLAQIAVKTFEKKAQLQIYFQLETEKAEIEKVQKKIEEVGGIEFIDYIDKEEAFSFYTKYYAEDPELVESASAEWLPESLIVRADTLEDLDNITKFVKEEEKINPHIEDVWYHDDVVKQLKIISKGITIGAIGIITLFTMITVSLIVVTIAFNIMTHKNEIEIMHLVGSSDSYIKLPFIIEGTIYTTFGALAAASIIMLPWLLMLNFWDNSSVYFIINDLLKELSLNSVRNGDPLFVLGFFGAHILIGAVIGLVSSSFAVMRNLNLREK